MLADALREVVRPARPRTSGFVAGVRAHGQVGALREVWEPLARALADLDATGQDAIVDAGRLGLVGSPEPLLANADLTLMLDPGEPARDRRGTFVVRIGEEPRHGLAASRHPRDRRRAALPRRRDREGPRPVRGRRHCPMRPTPPLSITAGAAPPRRFETGGYLRALTAAVGSVRAQVARSHIALVAEESR